MKFYLKFILKPLCLYFNLVNSLGYYYYLLIIFNLESLFKNYDRQQTHKSDHMF